MKKVFLFSILLILGLAGSQWIPPAPSSVEFGIHEIIRLLTTFCLAFIMIHVGHEFDIEKSKIGQYGKDYGIAATAAAFPWIFCALYFVFAMSPSEIWWNAQNWKESLLSSRFAAPTSAGILFSMLAAAGLAGTWMFRKARVLAIFDDLDTVLLMIPLKMMMVGLKWQLAAIVLLMFAQLWMGWKFFHRLQLPTSWPWVMFYSSLIVGGCEALYYASKIFDDLVPIHLEVLLPAFVLGCMLARHPQTEAFQERGEKGHSSIEGGGEKNAALLISSSFMVLVGLSMPNLAGIREGSDWPGWGIVSLHVVDVTFLSNLGKMFPLFCYKKEASWRERLALCIGMWPRGEVGAGVLAVSLSYGISGTPITVAMMSLALNLVLTGLFIVWANRLLMKPVKEPR